MTSLSQINQSLSEIAARNAAISEISPERIARIENELASLRDFPSQLAFIRAFVTTDTRAFFSLWLLRYGAIKSDIEPDYLHLYGPLICETLSALHQANSICLIDDTFYDYWLKIHTLTSEIINTHRYLYTRLVSLPSDPPLRRLLHRLQIKLYIIKKGGL